MTVKRLSTQELLAKSFEDLLSRKKLNSIAIRDITDNCGVSRQTFYNYFMDRNDLVYWIFCRDLLLYTDLIDGETYTWKEATLDSYKLYKEKSDFYRQALQDTGQNSINEFSLVRIEEECLNVIRRKHETFMPDDVFIFALQFYLKGTMSVINDWIITGCKKSPEVMSERVISCMPEIVKNKLL